MKKNLLFAILVFLFCSKLEVDVLAQWTHTGVNYSTIRAITVYNGSIYAGTDNGIYVSTDNGLVWNSLNNGPVTNTTQVMAITFKGTDILIATWGPGVFRSTDNGLQWTNVTNNMLQGGLYSIVVCSDGSILAGTVGNGIYRSDNNGSSWTLVLNVSSVWSMTIDNTIIYAGTTSGSIQRSTTNGLTWESFSDGLPAGAIIRAVTTISDKVFAGTTVYGAYYLLDSTWFQRSNGLPDDGLGQYQAVLAFAGNDSIVFAGTTGGVYMSIDNGVLWQGINDGLTETNIRALAITDSLLFTGTSSGGIWYRPLSQLITSVETSSENNPNDFIVYQNYPNPFNPSTTISFSIPKEEFVSLKVFNSLGEEVAVLINETKPAGNYSVSFSAKGGSATGVDASELTSGIYFYQINAGNFVETKKMMLIK
jgi:hypothetical protein